MAQSTKGLLVGQGHIGIYALGVQRLVTVAHCKTPGMILLLHSAGMVDTRHRHAWGRIIAAYFFSLSMEKNEPGSLTLQSGPGCLVVNS